MYAAQQKYRQTRYGCTPRTKQPPDLSRVINALRKQAQQRLGIPCGKNNIRAILARASNEYAERVPADELFRFLLNTGILIEESEGGKLHYDGERADEVLACCDAVREPEPSDSEKRLAVLRGEDPQIEDNAPEAMPAEEESLPAETPTEPESLSDEELELLTRPEVVEKATSSVLDVSDPPTEDFLPVSEEPTAEISSTEPVPVSRALYLTSVEANLWRRFCSAARKVGLGAWRLAVPATPELLYERWFEGESNHSEDEYDVALRRFIDHSVIKEVGATSGDQKTYFMSFDPDACLVIPISARVESLVTHDRLSAIRAIQLGRERTALHAELGAEYGIVVVEDGCELICVKGFERYAFVTPVTKVIAPPKRTPRPPRVAAPPPQRQIRSAPSVAPKRLQDETDARLAVLRDEHQKTIERAQAMIDQSKASIDAIDAELVRRAEEVERRKEEKRAVLQRQLADLQRQLAELDGTP